MSSTNRPITWLVTGASRGLGFALVKELVASSENLVVAACRNPEKTTALRGLKSGANGTLHIVRMDVSDFDSIRDCEKQLKPILGGTGLDYLINNAAIVSHDTPFALDPEEFLQVVRTNSAGPAVVSQVCLPFLEKGGKKAILHITSTGGSLQSVGRVGAGYTAYCMSKAALNMLVRPSPCLRFWRELTVIQALKQKAERPDLIIITLCPGRVKTDMDPGQGTLEPEDSVAGILKVLSSLSADDSGKFFSYDGSAIPW
ncbi:NAD-P-binding protein [Trametes sanguinea]|nr:NAD-P-binding protein [Trametes sanguinea]